MNKFDFDVSPEPGRDHLPILSDQDRSPAERNRSAQVALSQESPPGDEEPRIDIQDYIRILLKNRGLILAVIGFFVTAALIYSLLATRIYTATSSIQIEAKTIKIVETSEVVQNGTQDREFIQTQFQLLSSRRLAERVVGQLNLVQDNEFMGRNRTSLIASVKSFFVGSDTTGTSEASDAQKAASIIMDNTSIAPFPQTTIVRIKISDQNPQRARDIANAMSDGFVALNLDRRVEATAYARKFLEDQLSQLKLKLEDTERELIAFAQKEQIISLDKTSLIEANLATSNKDLGDAIADRIKAEEASRTAEGTQGGALLSIIENKLVQDLREKRATLAADYQDKLGSFKPDFPSMIQLRSRITELDRQLASEIATIKQALHATFVTARNRENSLAKHVETLKADFLDLQKRSVEYTILKRETDTSRSLYNDLLNRYKEVGVVGNTGVNNITVVDRALLPDAPTSPRTGLNLLISLVVGTIAAVGLAFLRDRLDDRMHSPEDVERTTKLVSIGIIPRLPDGSPVAAALRDPHSVLSEAYRSLATSLQFSTIDGLPKTLVVTSAGPGEGKSTTSVAIARHYATIGLQVLLVDCDLRKPALHKALEMPNDIGFSSYLAGRCTAPEAFQIADNPNLVFMGSGPLPPNPAELLSGPRFQTFVRTATQKFDLVIFDAAPVMGLADSPIIANAVAATMIVVAAGQSSRVALRKTLRRLQFSRAHIVGAVMTKFDAKAAGYGYGYGAGYGYGSEGDFSYGANNEQPSLPKTG